jgi:hypothetical protein
MDSEEAGEVLEATRTSAAVASQLSQEEAGKGICQYRQKTSRTRGTDWRSGSPGSGTEPPPPPQRLEAMGCTGGTPGAAERASGPIVATARPTVAVPQAPQVRFL